ncbi:MAG: ferritin-like domain-containing protein [Acetobacteraceae bacterium]
MTVPKHASVSPDDVQTIENVLEDVGTPRHTRDALLKRAAVGVLAASALGEFAGPAFGMSSGDTVESVVTTAVTAEALAVTYLTGVIEGLGKKEPVKKFLPVLKAANAAEYDHYKILRSLGAKPLTTKFWAPNAALTPAGVFPTIEAAETVFVNAYLVGITVFSKAGKPDLARYAGEILGTEAEHRALARFAQGKLPNNRAFESYALKTTAQHVAELEKLGIGFGKQGSKPGSFVNFSTPPASALTMIEGTKPA